VTLYRVAVVLERVYEIEADDENDLRAGIADGGYLDGSPVDARAAEIVSIREVHP
jgi:hypothetical protein